MGRWVGGRWVDRVGGLAHRRGLLQAWARRALQQAGQPGRPWPAGPHCQPNSTASNFAASNSGAHCHQPASHLLQLQVDGAQVQRDHVLVFIPLIVVGRRLHEWEWKTTEVQRDHVLVFIPLIVVGRHLRI